MSWLLRLIGGLFLLYLGVRTLIDTPTDPHNTEITAHSVAPSLTGAYASTLALTITNPATILAFTAIFAGLGFADRATNTGAALVMVLGVALGSALWWLMLTGGVGLLRRRVGVRFLRGVNVASGLLIGGFGLLSLWSLLATA